MLLDLSFYIKGINDVFMFSQKNAERRTKSNLPHVQVCISACAVEENKNVNLYVFNMIVVHHVRHNVRKLNNDN